MSILYVVSNRPGAGKTALCMALTKALRAQSRSVAAVKPVADGEDDKDAALYASLLNADVQGWRIEDADAVERTVELVRSLHNDNDIVIVEAANALTPEQSQEIADSLAASVLVLAGYDAALSHGAIIAAGAPYARLAGYIINGVTQYMSTSVRENLIPAITAQASMKGARILGVIPENRRLLGVSVSQLAAFLDGEFVSDEPETDDLIEYLMVGGLSLDPGEYYYAIHDNRAAITRGDRPDLQMSALSAPGYTACLIATGGVRPIEYVLYEAEQEEIPIILVEDDTLDTMAKLDRLLDGASFDHPDKLNRFVKLVEEHVDVPALLHVIS